jgi:hypothetical protein
VNEIQAQAVYGDNSKPQADPADFAAQNQPEVRYPKDIEEPGYPKDQAQNTKVGGVSIADIQTAESDGYRLAREVQLTLTAGLFAIKDPDTQSSRLSQLKFLTVLVESLLEEINARYGILPDSQTARLFALAEQASDILEQMP